VRRSGVGAARSAADCRSGNLGGDLLASFAMTKASFMRVAMGLALREIDRVPVQLRAIYYGPPATCARSAR